MNWSLLLNKYVVGVAVAIFLLAGFWIAGDVHGHRVASTAGDAKLAQLQAQYAAAEAKAQADARAKETASTAAMAAITAQHEKELQDAQANADRVIDDLRAGALRLRKQWQCPATASVSATAIRGPDATATADDRAESAGRIIGAADQADATIRALQRIVIQDRQN